MKLTKREAEFLLLALQWAEQDRDSLADANDVEGCRVMQKEALRERDRCIKLREKVRTWLHANKCKVLLTCKTRLQESDSVGTPVTELFKGKTSLTKKDIRKPSRKVKLRFSKLPLMITPKGRKLLDLSPTAYGKSTKDDWKEMYSKDWAKVLYLRKHKHFTAKDVLQEPDPREALNMPCQYPGCRTKTKTVNSNYCPAHRKRWEEAMREKYVVPTEKEEEKTRARIAVMTKRLNKKGAAFAEKNHRKEAANLRSAQAMITGEQ